MGAAGLLLDGVGGGWSWTCPVQHRKPYSSDASDEKWSLVVPYLTLMTEPAPQRDQSLRELFNALRYVIRYGIAWRAMPNDFPPWAAVYQQSQRWLTAECFKALAQDLRALLRLASGRAEEPTAAIIDSRTLRSTPQSGTRAGYDGARRKRGSKLHMAVNTLGHLLALHVTPADVGDRVTVKRLAADIQNATGNSVRLAYVDQGYTGDMAADAAAAEGIALHVVKLPEAKRGFVLLPRRWGWNAPLPEPHGAAVWSKTTSVMPQRLLVSTSSRSSDTCSNKPQT